MNNGTIARLFFRYTLAFLLLTIGFAVAQNIHYYEGATLVLLWLCLASGLLTTACFITALVLQRHDKRQKQQAAIRARFNQITG